MPWNGGFDGSIGPFFMTGAFTILPPAKGYHLPYQGATYREPRISGSGRWLWFFAVQKNRRDRSKSV
jgi:hypothetical protein